MDNYQWPKQFRELFDDALQAFADGKRDLGSLFDAEQGRFLDELGATPQEIFDFVEDTYHGQEPGFETTLLVTAVRRDYFLTVQKGQRSSQIVNMDKLPPKAAQLAGIEWLPRIIAKAKAKLKGEMPPDLMYLCGGDCAFLREHGLHAADFLREVWAADEDTGRILDFVRRHAAHRPANLAAPVCRILPGGRVKC